MGTVHRLSRLGSRRVRAEVEPLESRRLLAADLTAHWLAQNLNAALDDGSPVPVWTDSVRGIRATAAGQPVLAKDAFGGRSVIQFDPADGIDLFRVVRPDNPLAGAGGFSIVVAFATSSRELVGDNAPWFQSTGLVDSSNQGFTQDWGVALNRSGQIAAGLGGGFGLASTTVHSAEQGLNDGRLHVVIFTRHGTELSLYVDGGTPTVRNDASSAPRTTTVEMTIGANQRSTLPFTGGIAEVRFYNGALESTEVAALAGALRSFYNNAPPIANPDQFTVAEDTILFVPTQLGVLGNDVDPDGDALKAALVQTTRHGRLALREDGSLLYDPAPDFFGTDQFQYTAVDFRSSEVATVTIHVAPMYDPAVALDDAYKSLSTAPLVVDVTQGVLANDVNKDSVMLTALVETNVANGTLQLHPDGSFVYDPGGFAGIATFRYRIDDGMQMSSPATVTLTVNTAPVATDDRYQTSEDTVLTVPASQGVLANDSDVDRNTLQAHIVDQPVHGSVQFDGHGDFVYTPQPDYFGPDQFTYRANDGVDESELATVRIEVLAVNDPPTAVDDAYYGLTGDSIVRSASEGVLANDQDIDTDPSSLSAVLVQRPSHGAVDLRTDGSFVYTPVAGFSGSDRFTYRTSDGSDVSSEAQVTLLVGQSPVIISELLAVNVQSLTTRVRGAPNARFQGEAEPFDWIEIRNLSGAELDIGGFHLTDRRNEPRKWQFPAGTRIPASGYLIVFASAKDITDTRLDEGGRLHTNFRLAIAGEYLAITDRNGTVLHQYNSFPRQFADISYGITASGEAGYLIQPSPQRDNGRAYAGVVADVAMSVDHGFFNTPFTVELASPMPDAEIRYTLDGSGPTETVGLVYRNPITIDRTTTLRAAAFKPGHIPSPVATRTYLFLDNVLTQTRPDNLPDFVPRSVQFDMSQQVVNAEGAEPMIQALQAIPTLSIVTDLEHLYGRQGFWVNGGDPGGNSRFEHPASIELIYPPDVKFAGYHGFQINAGVQPHGTLTPKRSLQIEFKSRYGASSLEYPIFEAAPLHAESATDSFKRLVLRAFNNMSWHTGHHETNFLRDQWVRDLQTAISGAGSRGTYVHLYLNGQYFGMFNLVEAPDHDFMASYFGGEPEDYFAVKAIVERQPGRIISGDRGRFDEMVRRADARNLKDPDKYAEFQQYLDIDKYIDYVALFWYVAHGDGLDNNWHGGMRDNPPGPFRFFVWDAEASLTTLGVGPPSNPVAWVPPDFRPGSTNQTRIIKLWRALWDNEEFRVRFADRVYELISEGGRMCDNANLQRLNVLAEFIERAVRGESARWGRGRTLTKDWIPNVQLLRERIAGNADRLVTAMRRFGYYPNVDPPRLEPRGGQVPRGTQLVLAAPDPAVQVWYTLNGSDPRMPGNAASPDAILYDGSPIVITSDTVVQTRSRVNGRWSALEKKVFLVERPADATNLRITEIHYHPHDAMPQFGELATDADDFEFIELQNTSQAPINLGGVQLQQVLVGGRLQGVQFQFAPQTLAPQQQVVIVADLTAFQSRYGTGVPLAAGNDGVGGPDGQWGGGRLGNGGERITVTDARGNLIQQFDYDDGGPWPGRADGVGSSLEIVRPDGDPADSRNWRSSSEYGGTPGRAGSGPLTNVVINEILTRSQPPDVDAIELYNIAGQPIDIGGWYISDSSDNLFKYQIPRDGVVIPAGGYIVVDERMLGFGFKGSSSDDAWLIEADVNGKPIRFADHVRFGAADAGVSLGRWPNGNGDLFPQRVNTLGADNAGPIVGPVVISEVQYNPAMPAPERLLSHGELEFVEVWNHTEAPVDIGGWRLSEGVLFVFPTQTLLGPNSGAAVVSFDPVNEPAKAAEFRSIYAMTGNTLLLGPYQGVLDNGGETVELDRPVDVRQVDTGYVLVDRVDYDDDPPWPVSADGLGPSLQRTAPGDYGDLFTSWRAVSPAPGLADFARTPGDLNRDSRVDADDIDTLCAGIRTGQTALDLDGNGAVDQGDLAFFVQNILGTRFGDANLDGRFDSSDLVKVFQAGEYEDGIAGNSTWSEGDWNCDGEFDSSDLVLGFRAGGFERAAVRNASRGDRKDPDHFAYESNLANAADHALQLDDRMLADIAAARHGQVRPFVS